MAQTRYQAGDKIGGRYQVYRALKGGMGKVYLCLDENGKIVEHWEVLQRVPEHAENGNSMF